jgi:hypothetical protein
MAHSDNSSKGSKTYGRRKGDFKADFRTPQVRASRHKARRALRAGAEPAPDPHRHRALWDYF